MERLTGLPLHAKRPAVFNLDTLRQSKWLKTSQTQRSLPVLPGHAVFRMLCHASRVGALIGRSGNAIKQLQQSTKSKIRVEEAPVDSPVRVITVIAEASFTSKLKLERRIPTKSGYISEEEEIEVSKAQEALFRTFEVVLGPQAVNGFMSCRLLAHASHAGAVIGKGGNMVEKMRKETGCKISVLTEELPACVGPGEEVVELEGNVLAVMDALLCVSRCLQNCQPITKLRMVGSRATDTNPYVNTVSEARTWNFFDSVSDDALIRALDSVPLGVSRVQSEIRYPEIEDSLERPLESVFRDGFPTHNEAIPLHSFARELDSPFNDVLCGYNKAFSQEALCSQMDPYTQDALLRKKEAVFQVSLHRPLGIVPPDTFDTPSESRPLDSLAHHESFNRPTVTVQLESPCSLCNSTLESMLSIANGYQPYRQSVSKKLMSMEPSLSQQRVVFKILCPTDRAGCVIGKGGAIVRSLQAETGASVSLENVLHDCDERLLTITAFESPEDHYSPAQKAVALVFDRILGLIEQDKIPNPSKTLGAARLVVPSNQVGCLLGKGGSVISEIRKATRTVIQVMREDQNPNNIAKNERVVQISGGFPNLKEALYLLTGRLRDNVFSSVARSKESMSSSSQITERQPFLRRGELYPIDLKASVAQYANRDHTSLDHHLSPEQWMTMALAEPNSRCFTDFSGVDTGRSDLQLARNKSALVTNTIAEIRVPEFFIGRIYGEDGCILEKLRWISGANVVVQEPSLGSGDTIIIISGTPEETQAAQRLLQAFIITGELS